MDEFLKNTFLRPIATGTAILLPILIVQWLLGAFDIAPWTMELHQTAPGVIGLAITTWVTGHLVPIVYQAIEEAFRKT